MFKNKNQEGFTLLELLVVIGIIGLLASILVVNLTSTRKRARDTKRIADVRNLQTAAEDYYGKNGKYPVTIGDLVTGQQIPVWPLDPLAPSGTACTGNSDLCYWYSYYTPSGALGPQFYHFGASFEDPGSLLLNQDRDCNSITGLNCPNKSTSGDVPYTAFGFDGRDTPTAAGCGGAANRGCYDVAQ